MRSPAPSPPWPTGRSSSPPKIHLARRPPTLFKDFVALLLLLSELQKMEKKPYLETDPAAEIRRPSKLRA
jgi:hypothetical protein